MNELEKYKQQKSKKYDESPMNYSNIDDCEFDYINGFNAAIALDLPIKFAEYLAKNGIKPYGTSKQEDIYWMKFEKASYTNQGTTQQVFQYWLNNIYKP